MTIMFRIASMALIASSAVFVSSHSAAQPSSREAAAAAQAKAQGQLDTQGEAQYRQNALARCQRQPAGTARDACEKRVLGEGDTATRGSVESGGKLRSNTMQLPATEAPKK